MDLKENDLVRFAKPLEVHRPDFTRNNNRAPFRIIRIVENRYVAVTDRFGNLFADSGEGLWNAGHFEKYPAT